MDVGLCYEISVIKIGFCREKESRIFCVGF